MIVASSAFSACSAVSFDRFSDGVDSSNKIGRTNYCGSRRTARPFQPRIPDGLLRAAGAGQSCYVIVTGRLPVQPQVLVLEPILHRLGCVEAPDVLVDQPKELAKVLTNPVVVHVAFGVVVRVGEDQVVLDLL